MKITLRQLEIFVVIAKIGNMSRAAEALFLSQSACSMALTALETQLNGNLFDRHNKKLVLNDRGRVLLTQAVNIIGQVTELEHLMQDTADNDFSGRLTIGSSTTIGNYILPTIIGDFIRDYPQAKFNLKIHNTHRIIQQLLNFDIDIGFIEGRCSDPEIEIIPWRLDELIVIAAPFYPLAAKKTLTLTDLKQERWIFREIGSGTRSRFEEALGEVIIPFLELGHTEAIKQAVEAGIGISCLSKETVKKSLANGDLVAIKTSFLKLTRHFYMLLHKQKYRSQLLAEFMKRCRSSH